MSGEGAAADGAAKIPYPTGIQGERIDLVRQAVLLEGEQPARMCEGSGVRGAGIELRDILVVGKAVAIVTEPAAPRGSVGLEALSLNVAGSVGDSAAG